MNQFHHCRSKYFEDCRYRSYWLDVYEISSISKLWLMCKVCIVLSRKQHGSTGKQEKVQFSAVALADCVKQKKTNLVLSCPQCLWEIVPRVDYHQNYTCILFQRKVPGLSQNTQKVVECGQSGSRSNRGAILQHRNGHRDQLYLRYHTQN